MKPHGTSILAATAACDSLSGASQAGSSVWQSAQHGEDSADGDPPAEIVLQVDGKPLAAQPDDTVATALLRAGYTHFSRNAATGLPLAPTCLMGVCFGCLCSVDGRPGTQACLEPVREGLVVTTDASADVRSDVNSDMHRGDPLDA